MAPFRGRGGRGGARGITTNGKLARSGIRTKNGYKKFDSQRIKDIDSSGSEHDEVPVSEENFDRIDSESIESDVGEERPSIVNPYNILLNSFHDATESGKHKAKRRKIENSEGPILEPDKVEDVLAELNSDEADEEKAEEYEDEIQYSTDDRNLVDPFEVHFANPDSNELSKRLKDVQAGKWKIKNQQIANETVSLHMPESIAQSSVNARSSIQTSDLHLKERLFRNVGKNLNLDSTFKTIVSSYLFENQDLLLGNRNPRNAIEFRTLASLHALNHVLKGRDRVIKNNEKLSHADTREDLDCRDQGFVRPKVLLLLETRQMAVKYADSIVDLFRPDQQENKKRFTDSFDAPLDEKETMPEDYRELFDGNNDNSFLTALKFTRKTVKFYSAFYNSDVIIASPLGLRRILENEDHKKRDHDFLSSIEIVIVDQADAMYMQSWENVEVVFKHLNLALKEAHGCDFSRVRHWCLDGNAKYLRQTVAFSAYITPEMNRLFNASMLNVAGKARYSPTYAGAITETSGSGIKQTFSRFNSSSPTVDPDARFKYFTTTILPNLLRLPSSSGNPAGILIFIPSYFDFLRLRNFFATSTQTQHVSFGAVHDYAEVSDQRRARSHFLSGRHSFLLYTQRAHHFFRLRLRGVKQLVMYALPDNPIFFREMVEGMLGGSVSDGTVNAADASVKCAFSKWDGMKLERIVGSQRVKAMLAGVGDTFDFM